MSKSQSHSLCSVSNVSYFLHISVCSDLGQSVVTFEILQFPLMNPLDGRWHQRESGQYRNTSGTQFKISKYFLFQQRNIFAISLRGLLAATDKWLEINNGETGAESLPGGQEEVAHHPGVVTGLHAGDWQQFWHNLKWSYRAGQGPRRQQRLVSLWRTLNILNESLINIIENISLGRLDNNYTQWEIFDAVTIEIVEMPRK